MSASVAAVSGGTIGRRTFNPWIVALAVVVPTFMEVLDTTIANVALRYIAGGLSSAVTDSEWVITSYLAANAVILPISGWLAANLGRRRYTSLGQTISERREQFHALRLGENLDSLNPAVNSYLAQTQPDYLQQTGDPVGAQQMAIQSMADLRDQQALALSYFDCFLIFAAVSVILAFLVLLMKRSVAEKGAHVAAE
ncbi:MAG: hypothetical protein JO298_10400 [Verrucomicrobia bacterium]|nr:hypothetical protein [Verrucomicrobiota bacterium]